MTALALALAQGFPDISSHRALGPAGLLAHDNSCPFLTQFQP